MRKKNPEGKATGFSQFSALFSLCLGWPKRQQVRQWMLALF
jgi:hypothetical protein